MSATTAQITTTTAPLYRKPRRYLTPEQRIRMQSLYLAAWLQAEGVVYQDAVEAVQEGEE